MFTIKLILQRVSTLLVFLASLLTFSANAQDWGDHYSRSPAARPHHSDQHVIVYEDCNFEGKSMAVRPGDYTEFHGFDIGNDQISSIRVPRGLELTLFQHRNFKGRADKFTRDLSCLRGKQNDSASSMQIGYVEHYSDGRINRTKQNTIDNINFIQIEIGALRKIREKNWTLFNSYGHNQTFIEVSRAKRIIFMKSQKSADLLRVNFNTDTLSYIGSDGSSQDFKILNTARSNKQTSNKTSSSPSRRIKGNCFTFKAYTDGGNGGILFYGKDNFTRLNKSPKTGRVCHTGALTMEITKKDMDTSAFVEIKGNKYSFLSNEPYDKYSHHTYRKRIRLVVGTPLTNK